jgi:hypothetical protein
MFVAVGDGGVPNHVFGRRPCRYIVNRRQAPIAPPAFVLSSISARLAPRRQRLESRSGEAAASIGAAKKHAIGHL